MSKTPKGSSAPHKPLTDAQRRLVEDNYEYAKNLGKRFSALALTMGVPTEDLMQEACYGLCIAARKWNPAAGTDFMTYAYDWCVKYIRLALENENVTAYEDLEADVDSEGMTRAIDPIDDDPYEEDPDDDPAIQMDRLLKVLCHRERRIVCLVYGISLHPDAKKTEPLGFKEIAQKLHLTTTTVRNIYHRAMNKMECSSQR